MALQVDQTAANRAWTRDQCGEVSDLPPLSAEEPLAAQGGIDEALALVSRQENPTAVALFWPTSRAMRADPCFLPLVEKLGLMGYWRASKSQPGVCETKMSLLSRAKKAGSAKL